MGRRHPDVDNDRIRWVLRDASQQLIGRPTASGDFYARICQKLRDTLAQQHVVLSDGYPHGISARTRVPWPAALQILSWPFRASTRSASPRNPVPRSESAPPMPSSTISTIKVLSATFASTVTWLARACLAAFVRLSETT